MLSVPSVGGGAAVLRAPPHAEPHLLHPLQPPPGAGAGQAGADCVQTQSEPSHRCWQSLPCPLLPPSPPLHPGLCGSCEREQSVVSHGLLILISLDLFLPLLISFDFF